MKLHEHVQLKTFSTMRVPATARYLVHVETLTDIKEALAFAKQNNLRVLVLGGGSNTLFSGEKEINALILKIEIAGFTIVFENDEYVEVKVGAGEEWDAFVDRVAALGYSGIEMLSAIPGTVGATPVQNVGAYGGEIADTFVSLEAYEIATGEMRTLVKADCNFAYRESIFKNEYRDKYIITTVTFRLSKKAASVPNYPGVAEFFAAKGIVAPTLMDIRQAIIAIRGGKLPDPKIIPSLGSFFKNPFVSVSRAEKLRETFPDIKTFPVDDTQVKIPAGWLIEKVGLKGVSFGVAKTYDKNALVLTHDGTATAQDIFFARDQIIETVLQKFGITLEQEPDTVF